METETCPSCGANVDSGRCRSFGWRPEVDLTDRSALSSYPRRALGNHGHRPKLAVLCGLLIIGGAQFYNRQILKGLLCMIGGVTILTIADGHFIAYLVVYLVTMADGFFVAEKIRKGQRVRRFECFKGAQYAVPRPLGDRP